MDGKPPAIRASKNARWRALVLVAVHLLVAAHIAHWMSTGRTASPLEPSEAMEFSKHGIVNTGLVFFALTILSTLVLGRWFCGWACHLVALQDGCLWILRKLGIRPKPLRSRLLGFVPLIAAVYMFLWPLAYRLWHTGSVAVTEVALTKEGFWDTFPPWPIALLTFVVCGGVIIYFLGAKGFCTYGCPYGAIFGVADLVAPGRIRVTDACEGCGHCTATCTSNVVVHQEVRDYGMVVDPGCMKCMDCVSVCPMNALYFGFGKPSVAVKKKRAEGRATPSRLPWREELVLAGAFVVAFVVYRGLYGLVPFLLALGWAAILAFLTLIGVRLVRRRDLTVTGRKLKSGGRLTAAGKGFAAILGLIALATVHSALIQYHFTAGQRILEGTLELQGRALEVPDFELSPGEREQAAAGLGHARFQHRYGIDTPDGLLQLAWFSLLDGNEARFEELMRDQIERFPTDTSLRIDFARYFEVRGRLDEAQREYEGMIASLRNVVEREPERVRALEDLAGLLCTVGRFEEALPLFRRALDLQPDAGTLTLLVRAHLALGDPAGAHAELEQAAQRGWAPPEAIARMKSSLGG